MIDPQTLPDYEYGGAKAMVLLHDRHLHRFLDTWQRAKAMNLRLPESQDPDCKTLEAILRHVCAAARGYMVWMCQVLELPDPAIDEAPPLERLAAEAEAYVEHLGLKWSTPLAGVSEELFYRPEHAARWKTKYCIDAMLEHAVMHPLRHEFQIERLLTEAAG